MILFGYFLSVKPGWEGRKRQGHPAALLHLCSPRALGRPGGAAQRHGSPVVRPAALLADTNFCGQFCSGSSIAAVFLSRDGHQQQHADSNTALQTPPSELTNLFPLTGNTPFLKRHRQILPSPGYGCSCPQNHRLDTLLTGNTPPGSVSMTAASFCLQHSRLQRACCSSCINLITHSCSVQGCYQYLSSLP